MSCGHYQKLELQRNEIMVQQENITLYLSIFSYKI